MPSDLVPTGYSLAHYSYVRDNLSKFKETYSAATHLFPLWVSAIPHPTSHDENIVFLATILTQLFSCFPATIRLGTKTIDPTVFKILLITRSPKPDCVTYWSFHLMRDPTISIADLYSTATTATITKLVDVTLIMLSTDASLLSDLAQNYPKLTLGLIPKSGWLKKPIDVISRELLLPKLPVALRPRLIPLLGPEAPPPVADIHHNRPRSPPRSIGSRNCS